MAFYFISATIVFLLLCSAFFSASETALTAITRPQIHQLAAKGRKQAKILQKISTHMSRVLGTILLGNNLVNILATSLATHLFIQLFGDTGVGIATLCMTFLILIFSELMPKLYAIYNPERVSLLVSPVMHYCIRLFFPFTQVVRNLAERLWELLGVPLKQNKQTSSHEELRGAIDIFGTAGKKDQKDMLHSILDLSHVTIEEVMIHRKDVETINQDDTLKDIKAQVLKSPYTRIPVWHNNPENIVGVLHIKTFLKEVEQQNNLRLEDIYQKPLFAPETTSLSDQIEHFRKDQQHLSIVVDEYGDVQGIVTLQDILEEILGKMQDEHDVRTEEIQGNATQGYTIEGSTTLRDIKRKTALKITHKEATTLGGFLLYEAREIPRTGQVYKFQNLRFEILRCHRHQVKRVKVTRIDAHAAPLSA